MTFLNGILFWLVDAKIKRSLKENIGCLRIRICSWLHLVHLGSQSSYYKLNHLKGIGPEFVDIKCPGNSA